MFQTSKARNITSGLISQSLNEIQDTWIEKSTIFNMIMSCYAEWK
jgi:hypothetical protein